MRPLDKTVLFKSSTVHKLSVKGLQSATCWQSTSVEVVLKYDTINHFSQFKQGDMLSLNISLAFRNLVFKSPCFLNMLDSLVY